ASQTVEQMVDRVLQYPDRTRLQILAPVISGKKGEHDKLIEKLKKEGYIRLRVNGELMEISDDIDLDRNKKHSIDVVIDRIIIKEGVSTRLSDSIEAALKLGEGRVIVDLIDQEDLLFNEHHSCPICGFSISEL